MYQSHLAVSYWEAEGFFWLLSFVPKMWSSSCWNSETQKNILILPVPNPSLGLDSSATGFFKPACPIIGKREFCWRRWPVSCWCRSACSPGRAAGYRQAVPGTPWPGPHSGYRTCEVFGMRMDQPRPLRTSWKRHRVNKLIYREQSEVWAEPGFPICSWRVSPRKGWQPSPAAWALMLPDKQLC